MFLTGSGSGSRTAIGRGVTVCICALGWVVLAAAVIVPLIGTVWAAGEPGYVGTGIVGTPPAWKLIVRSMALSVTATVTALALGAVPAAVLGSCTRRQWPWLLGLLLTPLMVPPQVYAYAWGLLPPNRAAQWAAEVLAFGKGSDQITLWEAVWAGLISAGWLWPIVSLIIAAGWRSTGEAVYRLALLDTSGFRAFFRAVLPSLRPQVAAAAALVGIITIVEYPIPHLALCRVWATELMVLVEIGAPPGQIIRMAAQPVAIVGGIVLLAALAVRGSARWQAISQDDATPDPFGRLNSGQSTIGAASWGTAALVWVGTVGGPIGLMLANLRVPGAWIQGLRTFATQWADSLEVSLAAGFLAVSLAVATIGWWQASGRKLLRWAGLLSVFLATIPPAALGVGFVVVFNRSGFLGDLYAARPVVWILALVARYGAVAVLITWLAVGRRSVIAVDQARVDGARSLDILGHVLLPMLWPSLVSAGMIVSVLAAFEVVVTQMTRPPAYGSIAMTILNYMHYGRDDAVITSTLAFVVAVMILTQACGHLLTRVGK